MISKQKNKPKPIAIDKKKYIALAKEIQSIVAQEQATQHAK